MKKHLFFISVFLSAIFPVQSSFAGNDSPEDKLRYYLNEAKLAYENKDYSFACKTATHSLIFAKEANGGKDYNKVKEYSDSLCKIYIQESIKEISRLKNNNPYYKLCPSYNQVKESCAAANDYSACMNIRWGVNHKDMNMYCEF